MSDVINHIKVVHENIKEFNCLPCNKWFGSKSGMRSHVKRVHEDLKPFRCDSCNKCFTAKCDLDRHVIG